MAYRIDVGIRFTDIDKLNLQYPSGGAAHTITLSDGSTGATTAGEMSTALQGRLQTVNAGFSVSQTTSTIYTITHSSTAFDLHFGSSQSLADFLGFPAASASGSATATGNSAPSIFIGSRGCVVTPGVRWQMRRTELNHGEGRSVKLLRQDIYKVTLQLTRGELKKWRECQRYLLQGHPFTLYQTKDSGAANGFKSTAFSKTNILGSIYCQMDSDSTDIADTQLTDPYQSDVSVEFIAVSVATTGGALSL